MAISNFSIHFQDKETPEVKIKTYNDFFVVSIIQADTTTVQLFFDSLQQVTNFKNNLLWVFENLEKY